MLQGVCAPRSRPGTACAQSAPAPEPAPARAHGGDMHCRHLHRVRLGDVLLKEEWGDDERRTTEDQADRLEQEGARYGRAGRWEGRQADDSSDGDAVKAGGLQAGRAGAVWTVARLPTKAWAAHCRGDEADTPDGVCVFHFVCVCVCLCVSACACACELMRVHATCGEGAAAGPPPRLHPLLSTTRTQWWVKMCRW